MAAARFCFLLAIVLLVSSESVRGADWPAWRYGADRSASSPQNLADDLSLQWIRQFAPPKPAWPEDPRLVFDGSYEPIVVGQTLFLASAQNDAITALDTRTGKEKWKFFADGPIRFAPVADDGQLYFGADDGCIYCLSTETGKLAWKFTAAPAARRVLGNDRMSSVLPVRGGPVISDGKLFFTVGVWPFEGTFLYWLDLKKINAGNSPESAFGVASLTDMTPQGYLVASEGKLFIPCGRATVGLFDIEAESLAPLAYDSRGLTDYFVTASQNWLFHGHRVIDLETKAMLPISAPRPVSDGSTFYIAQGDNLVAADILKQPQPKAVQGKAPETPPFKASWFINTRAVTEALGAISAARHDAGPLSVDLKAGERVYGRWGNAIYAADPPSDGQAAHISWAAIVEGTPTSMIAADDRLFVSTAEGQLFCFGPQQTIARIYPASEESQSPEADESLPLEAVVASLPDPHGFCLLWGADSNLANALLAETGLDLLVIDPDATKIEAIRKAADAKGLYGSRLAALTGRPLEMRLPPYFATLSLVADPELLPAVDDGEGWTALFEMIRPYGGAALLPLSEAAHAELAPALESLPRAALVRVGSWSLLRREGALEGAANWSHEYGRPL